MKTDLFDYYLPNELIAQEPLPQRDSSRLMVLQRCTKAIEHRRFSEIPHILNEGDCLVLNTTRVFPGRLRFLKRETGGKVELLLVRKVASSRWVCLSKGASLRNGTLLVSACGNLAAQVVEGWSEGRVTVLFTDPHDGHPLRDDEIFACGEIPLPPYIRGDISDSERYQTIYSRNEISAAAPTAGLHFTDELLGKLRERGIRLAEIELAVGMDTFVPVREEEIEKHQIHAEWFEIGEVAAEMINQTRKEGGRIVAVGTTSVRCLETASRDDGIIYPMKGYTSLFILPGYEFKTIDTLLTNFHFPRSTLLALVSAFAGRELIMKAYEMAVREKYRFYSFGDAMLIL
ncbi:MAG: tRNA preQ1(34) S-adenosylmethionine ribosyltransferase-isomerase QueA [Actinomycetota bacterium]|nr:tRNA preQ1(34) S-adenosylmethionine ribosyltransferase-isomerase QueA [Actinomycetota bacterium]